MEGLGREAEENEAVGRREGFRMTGKKRGGCEDIEKQGKGSCERSEVRMYGKKIESTPRPR